MTTRNLVRIIISTFALAGAVFAFAGCSTPAGQTAQRGQKETDRVADGINAADSTVNKAADTTEKISKTARRLFK
ncbi:hypothetical protein [Ereboglobus luteus]|uniref:Entericidin EcnAB n=1 Tax=Ereboglobus luteus TaxID=1796921 RepID=A0A2U8E231_9BACT|nr:hypothetical protein [Ereboglobus luteus]AWI08582.1 hypothetical protein CKA38_04320 [Ereboglobus luteus]